jgi:glutamine phosphoribosylpyrophosphate amidotransferase
VINQLIQQILPSINSIKDNVEKEGVSLPKQYNLIAKQAGITNIEKIKILYVDKIEFIDLKNMSLLEKYNLTFENARGLTLGYCVILQKSAPSEVLLHELRHVAQSELFENLEQFVTVYVKEILKFGYGNGPLEKDAINFTNKWKEVYE